jgi:hypothetical protein
MPAFDFRAGVSLDRITPCHQEIQEHPYAVDLGCWRACLTGKDLQF